MDKIKELNTESCETCKWISDWNDKEYDGEDTFDHNYSKAMELIRNRREKNELVELIASLLRKIEDSPGNDFINWLFAECKIIHHIRDSDAYPIEHAPNASKISRDLIEAEYNNTLKRYVWVVVVMRRNLKGVEYQDTTQYQSSCGPVTAEHVRTSPSVRDFIGDDILMSITPKN